MSHHHHSTNDKKALTISIIINVIISTAQMIGGIISGSIALISDAIHNISDSVSLIVSYIANALVDRKPNKTKTFGYKRAEIIGAFVNSLALLAVSIILIIEAVKRLNFPQEINYNYVIWFSSLAILGNAFSTALLHKGKEKNLNLKSAYLHMLSDTLTSVAVLIGGILIKEFKIYTIDTILTFIISAYLIYMSIIILKETTEILMMFAPKKTNIDKIIKKTLLNPEVKNVHKVRLWKLDEHKTIFDAHILLTNDTTISEFEKISKKIEKMLKEEFGINSTNLTPEFNQCEYKETV